MILIKGGRLMDPRSGTDKIADLVLDGDRITDIGKFSRDGAYTQIIEAAGKIVAPGLIDVHVHFRDPGFPDKEDILSGAKSAAAGGYTTVVCMANTKPVVDTVETLDYILGRGKQTDIHLLSAAAVTRSFDGKTLTDMDALQRHGAVGFTDDGVPIADSGVLRAAMVRAKALGVPLSLHEEDPALLGSAGVNAGDIARQLGVEGASAASEYSLIARDCMLALDTGATVNIQHVSAAVSVEVIRFSKRLGAKLFAEVTPQHFSLTEEAVQKVGALAKVNPPLRTEADRQRLIQGLADGTIDLIATDHAPHTAGEKAEPWGDAPSGMIGLETALSLGITHLVQPGHLTMLQLLEKMTVNPARLYQLDAGTISEGGAADLVIFDPETRWQVSGQFASRACNAPFIGETLQGKVSCTICGGKIIYSKGGS